MNISTMETSPADRVAARILARAPLFEAASVDARARLHAAAVERTLPRGAALFRPGFPSDGVAVVLEGRLSCAVVDASREQWVRRVAEAGQICGLNSVLDDGPLPCTIAAIVPTRVLLIPAAAIRKEFAADAELMLLAASMVARELRRVTSLCGAIACHTPLQRVARYLLERSRGADSVEVLDTQEQIGAQIGTVREVVGRALRSLEGRGLIRRRGRRVGILATAALRDVAAWTTTDDALLLSA